MESEIFAYFDDTLAFRSVASRSRYSLLNLKISLSFFKKSKGGTTLNKKKIVFNFHEIENMILLLSRDLTNEIC